MMQSFKRVTSLASILTLIGFSVSAQPTTVTLPASSPFPESLSVGPDGALYASSISHGGVTRALPGASEATMWIKPGTYGTRSTFGVLADPRTNTLWVCSNDASVLGLKGPNAVDGGYLKGFDLKTGNGKISARLPGPPVICNDIAPAADGSVIVSDTAAPMLLRLKPGNSTFEVWLKDDRLKGGLDGLAFGPDGALYVNTFNSGEFFRIAVNSGAAGAVTKLTTSRPLTHPDGMKPYKDGFLMVEGVGTLDRVTISGGTAKIETVGQFAGPTGVAIHGGMAWVSEGQLSHLTDLKDPSIKLPSFQLRAIPLPAS